MEIGDEGDQVDPFDKDYLKVLNRPILDQTSRNIREKAKTILQIDRRQELGVNTSHFSDQKDV